MGKTPAAARILYVEDDATSAKLMQATLEQEGYSLEIARTGREFQQVLGSDPPDLCIIDLSLPDVSGLDLLRKMKQIHLTIPVIVVTASNAIEDAVSSMKSGASDYVTKPFDGRRISVSIRNALKLGRQGEELARLRSEVQRENTPESLVGSSPPMDVVRGMIRRVAASDATVLVAGENGTGKELVARALHFTGPRGGRPFVDVNCAALTESLLESELFGHEQGAFTGATGRRRGKFEQAQEGTLFLDEISDMPPPTQAKILRVLQERAFQRVGGEERIRVDVRVIGATNRDLEEAVRRGQFRKDLFYRINTVVIEIPPLRARVMEIPELARHFLVRAARREKRSVDRISDAALEALARHSWPGNVRELQHAIDRAVLVSDGAEIRPEHLPPSVTRAPAQGAAPNLIEAVEHLERTMIVEALEKNAWVKARAARALGLTERMISYKMQNLGIEGPPA